MPCFVDTYGSYPFLNRNRGGVDGADRGEGTEEDKGRETVTRIKINKKIYWIKKSLDYDCCYFAMRYDSTWNDLSLQLWNI